MGSGVIGVVLGLLVSAFLLIFALVWYPAKRLGMKLRNTGGATEPSKPGETGQKAEYVTDDSGSEKSDVRPSA